jgi:hypothetical protein
MQLAKFRKIIQKKTSGNEVTLIQEKIKMLPPHIEEDPYEAILYLYFCVRYYDE